MSFSFAVKAYQSIKATIIKEVGDINTYLREIPFVDHSLIKYGIESLQRKHKEIVARIDAFSDEENPDHAIISDLISAERQICIELAMLISHRIEDIDYSLSLVANIDTDYKLCLRALKAYSEKDYDRSLALFYEYISTANRMPETYVANTIIARILFGQREYSKAIAFLRYAVSKKPDDLELHRMLQTCYTNLNQIQESEVERQIVEILEVPA
jgi:tetratricopeptide (TPR) repeat protein